MNTLTRRQLLRTAAALATAAAVPTIAHAGTLETIVSKPEPLPRYFLPGGGCFTLRVRGDSMAAAGFADGALVQFQHRHPTELREGDCAFIRETDGPQYFRRVHTPTARDAFLRTADDGHSRYVDWEDVNVLAVAVAVITPVNRGDAR